MCYVHCHHATLKTSLSYVFFCNSSFLFSLCFSYVHFLSFFATNISIFLLLALIPPLLFCGFFSIVICYSQFVTHKVASCSCILMFIVYGFFCHYSSNSIVCCCSSCSIVYHSSCYV